MAAFGSFLYLMAYSDGDPFADTHHPCFTQGFRRCHLWFIAIRRRNATCALSNFGASTGSLVGNSSSLHASILGFRPVDVIGIVTVGISR